jgi:hypothetical protein
MHTSTDKFFSLPVVLERSYVPVSFAMAITFCSHPATKKKDLEHDLCKHSVCGPQNPKASSSTSHPNLRVFSAVTPGISSSLIMKPVVAGSTPDPAVLASAVTAAEQRGSEHLRQVMFLGKDLDPISCNDSDLDDDGLLNDGPDTSEKQEEHQSKSPEPLQNVSLLYGFQSPTNAFHQEHASLGNPVLPVPIETQRNGFNAAPPQHAQLV